MVTVLTDRPNTSLWRNVAPDGELPSVTSSICPTRDFAHLAVTLCRCMNIPARYCTGYLGDIGVPRDPAPMDFSAWFEVFLGGRWYSFDARHNHPRIGRIVMARGRDAADVAISTSFGPSQPVRFNVVTEGVAEHPANALEAA
jgi:transglutaminase-like putative cysteine protease